MLAALIPLFDNSMSVKAYSLFTQKENFLLNPSLLGTGSLDGAGTIEGLDIVENMGIETLTPGCDVFIEVTKFSCFSPINEMCSAKPERIVLLADYSIEPNDMYVKRFTELKEMGYQIAFRKLQVSQFEEYKPLLNLANYIFLDHKKIKIEQAQKYFSNVYPNIKLVAVNVNSQDDYTRLSEGDSYSLYEGEFFRVPITKGLSEVSPLKVNYIELLNVINDYDFDLTKAADVISRDTALVINLLKIVNRMSVNSEITSIRVAAAMLGQRELKKWINSVVTKELCADKPNEITRLSLLRAKFAENLAPCFSMAAQSSELFLMGLFSVLDIILDKPMQEALQMVKVSKQIQDALIDHAGVFSTLYDFMVSYEQANWAEVSRLMVIDKISDDQVYDAYEQALVWYKEIFA